MLINDEIKEKYKKYCNLLMEHKKNLHENDNPIIEDDEYDKLKRLIEDVENKYPDIVNLMVSPIHYIGSNLKKELKTVNHNVKMESLHDSFTFDEIKKFCKRTSSLYSVEPKIDGISVSVIYENSVLKTISTRGNGFIGEDVTRNISKIKNLPNSLNKKIEFLEVRGEVYMPKKKFFELLKWHEEFDGTKPFKNPRNAAAGIMRHIDFKKDYHLEILFFNVQQIKYENFNFKSPWKINSEDKNLDINNFIFKTHIKSLSLIRSIGLPTVDSYLCNGYEEVIKKIKLIKDKKNDFSFQIDGSVIKVNDLKERSSLGSTDTAPRWAEAFKYTPEEKITKILKIENKIGRSGVITPVAYFDKIELSGTIVSRASLHNYEYIKNKDIRVGDYIRVRKAGDIIPEIVGILNTNEGNNNIEIDDIEKYHENLEILKEPEKCESCGMQLYKDKNKVILKCKNKKCKSRIIEKIIHFCSRNAMNIDGLGKSIIKEFVDKKLLNSITDIYKLSAKKICEFNISSLITVNSEQIIMEGFVTNALNENGKKILKEIENSKKNHLNNFIYALGIPFVGQDLSYSLAKKFGDFKTLIKVKFDDLVNMDGVGETSAREIVNYFENENIEYFKKINFIQ